MRRDARSTIWTLAETFLANAEPSGRWFATIRYRPSFDAAQAIGSRENPEIVAMLSIFAALITETLLLNWLHT